MPLSRLILILIFLLPNFLFLNFPAAKIIVYGIFVYIFLNYVYYKLVEKSVIVERKNQDYHFFSGINEEALLEVWNRMPLPVHALLVSDKSDLSLSVRQVYSFLVSLEGGERKLLKYNICGRKRGKYIIGPTVVKFSDFSGIFSFEMDLSTEREVIVFPAIRSIGELPYKSLQPQGNFRNKVPIYEDVSMIKGLKEYQQGDELKRINWKISARHNKFLVNTYDYSVSMDSLIILNLYDEDYNFKEKDYYREMAIEVVASIINYLNLKKERFAFLTNARKDKEDLIIMIPAGNGGDHFVRIVSELAVIQASKNISLINAIQSLRISKWGTSLYLVTPIINEEIVTNLLTFYRTGHSIVLFTLGPKIVRGMDLKRAGFLNYHVEVKDGVVTFMDIGS